MIPLPEQQIRDIANGLNGVSPKLGQWQRDLMLARAVEATARRQALEEAAQWYVRKRGGQSGTVGHAWAEIEAQELRSLIDKDTATSDATGL